MEGNAGVWVNREVAWVVQPDKKDVVEVRSGLEPHVRLSGGSRGSSSYGPMDKSDEKKADRKFELHLQQYLQRVIDEIAGCSRVVIYGPGETKRLLKKKIERDRRFRNLEVTVKQLDKRTKPQFAAEVKGYFETVRWNPKEEKK